MVTYLNKKVLIKTPRPMEVYIIQSMTLLPFSFSLIAIMGLIVSIDLISLLFFFIPFMIGSAIFYFSERSISRVEFNKKQNTLNVRKKGVCIKQISCNGVKCILSKTIETMLDSKHVLSFEKEEANSVILFNEDTTFGSSRWPSFAEKLSSITDLPLKKEYWIEDDNGKISLMPSRDRIFKNHKNKLMLLVYLIFPLFAAIGYKIYPTQKNLILFGIFSALTNFFISFYFILKNKNILDETNKNFSPSFFLALTLIIPFIFVYLIFVSLLVGYPLL